MKTSEVLYKAADVIRAKGWCRYKLQNEDGCVCVQGAINTVVSGNALTWGGFEAAAFAARVLFDADSAGYGIIDFNNEQCESGDDMTAALEIAADIAHAEGH